MIIIDRREPDELYQRLLQLNVPVCDPKIGVEMKYGDVMFTGNGPDGQTVLVGCERKKLGDLINSMKDRRLAGSQLRGMRQTYDYLYLFTEGVWRPGKGGEIEELQGSTWRAFYSKDMDRQAINYRQLISYLTTLELKPDEEFGKVVRWRRNGYLQETARQIAALYTWFNDKQWHEHKSADVIYTGAPIKGHGNQWAREHTHDENYGTQRARLLDSVTGNPTTLWRAASQLPGIDSKARQVTAHFGTMLDMVLAGVPEEMKQQVRTYIEEHPREVYKAWQAVGNGIGPKTAQAVVKAITEIGG